MKVYGIYLAYPPPVDLRAEGLGRLLAEFLRAANRRGDVRFVIACPSWSRKSLQELFDDADIPSAEIEIIGPKTRPAVLRFYDAYRNLKRRKYRKGRFSLSSKINALSARVLRRVEHALVSARSSFLVGLLMLLALPILMGGIAIYAALKVVALLMTSIFLLPLARLRGLVGRFYRRSPDLRRSVSRLFRFMLDAEAKLISDYANARTDIRAWYSPTAFWPHFNLITAPRLICVPDVVLSNFPVAFSSIGGRRGLEAFRSVEATIGGGDRFITFSDDVKFRTLADRYQVAPDAVSVVRHGANQLDAFITMSGSSDNEAAIAALCGIHFQRALEKMIGGSFVRDFHNSNMRFIFYASQFRPNKNVISLLRAYEYLLKRRYVGHKLVLTGNPKDLPEIAAFIADHNLQNDVLCLHGLSARELAACYRLADLAVNPSLSEGGCPFTLTEALSVGTPVVMARIAVTEEVVTDPEMQDLMLFDPYDWKAIADKIEWALQNKDMLLERQLPLYTKLAERTWQNVVDEHVAILDRISSEVHQSSPR